jgi:hypothetical protein
MSALCLTAVLCVGIAGCKSNSDTADAATDPADINNASATGDTNAPQQAAAPQSSGSYSEPQQSSGGYSSDSYDQGYEAGIEAQQPPPALPEYTQPECPQPNYLWTPGYWHYASAGYYWVPGVWVAPPYVGALWTPGYWGYSGGFYRFRQGYWGAHIGFYGGVSYGFGYNGAGFFGGYWNRGNFTYNRTVTNINTTIITNTYTHNVVNIYNNNTHVSYNGGSGGLQVRPTQAQIVVLREPHIAPLPQQIEHRQQAAQNHAQYYSANGGHPAVLAAPRPIELQHVAAAPGLVNPGFRGEVARPHPAETMKGPESHPAETMRGPEPSHPETKPMEHAQPGHPEAGHNTMSAHPETHEAAPHPAARPEAHPAAKPEAHPMAKPEAHPAAKPEAAHAKAKPQGKPEEHPEEKKKPE